MNVPIDTFWRAEPLTLPEITLIELLYKAHSDAVNRQNISSVIVANAALGSGRYASAISSATASIGGVHAPIEETIDAIESAMDGRGRNYVTSKIGDGEKVAGWGNSFHKGGIEPEWMGLMEAIEKTRPDIAGALESITCALHDAGKIVFPNPSAFTAAVAIIIGLPRNVAAMLFIAARLSGWTKIIHETLK